MPATLLTNGIQYPDNSIQTSAPGIKSIQSIFVMPRGTATGDYGANRAVDVTISAVDTSKSFIIYSHSSRVSSSSTANIWSITAKFINSSTVQLCCFSATNVTSIRFQVIEFK